METQDRLAQHEPNVLGLPVTAVPGESDTLISHEIDSGPPPSSDHPCRVCRRPIHAQCPRFVQASCEATNPLNLRWAEPESVESQRRRGSHAVGSSTRDRGTIRGI